MKWTVRWWWIAALAVAACGGAQAQTSGAQAPMENCQPVGRAAESLHAELTEWIAQRPTDRIAYAPLAGRFSPGEPVDDALATAILRDLYTVEIVQHRRGRRAMEWQQARNDCEDRAHVAAGYLRSSYPNVSVGKIFVAGDPSRTGDLGANERLMWSYHVAPVIVVRGTGGALDLRVLDPAVDRERPLTTAAWVAALDRRGQSAEPAAAITVSLTGPGVWTYGGGGAGPDRTDSFCSDVTTAGRNLSAFAGHPRFFNQLNRVTFVGEDADGRVRFRGFRGTAFGPFTADATIRRYLAGRDEPMTVRVQRMYAPQNHILSLWWNFENWAANREQTVLCIDGAPAPIACE